MHSIAIKGYWHTAAAISTALLLVLGSFFFSYTAHAETDDSEFIVTETISPILNRASLVFTAISETLKTSGSLAAAASNSQIEELQAEIARLNELLKQYGYKSSVPVTLRAEGDYDPDSTSMFLYLYRGGYQQNKNVYKWQLEIICDASISVRGKNDEDLCGETQTYFARDHYDPTNEYLMLTVPVILTDKQAKDQEVVFRLTAYSKEGKFMGSDTHTTGLQGDSGSESRLIRITSPNNGDVWRAGSQQSAVVEWTAENLGNLKLGILITDVRSGGIVKQFNNISNTNTRYSIALASLDSEIPAGAYHIQVCTSEKGGGECSVQVPVTIRNSRPLIVVTSPGEGFGYRPGDTLAGSISYGGLPTNNFSASLYKADAQGISYDLGPVSTGGYFNWVIPSSVDSGPYNVYVCHATAASQKEFCGKSGKIEVTSTASQTQNQTEPQKTSVLPVNITSISPGNAVEGKSTTFVISGSGFGTDPVIHYTNKATGNSGTIKPSYAQDTEIVYALLPQNVGTYSVYVKNSYGTVSNTKDISIIKTGTAPDIWTSPREKISVTSGGTATIYWDVTPTTGTVCAAAGTGVYGSVGNGKVGLVGSWTTPKLYTDTTYGIKCTGSTGLVSYKYVQVDVTDEAPASTSNRPVISVTPESGKIVNYGDTVTFTWSVLPASGTTCQAAGNGVNGATGSGAVSTSGNWTSPKLYVDTTYGIKCTNAAGTVVKYISIDVGAETGTPTTAKPTISLAPNGNTSVAYGGKVSFYWSVYPVSGTTCQAAGNGINGAAGSGAVSTSGTWTSPALYVDTTYGIKCTNAGGTETKYVNVDVAADTSAPTTVDSTVTRPSISLSPSNSTSVAYGGKATFIWSVTPSSGTTCQAAGTGVNGATGSGAVNTTGNWTTPALYTDTTYGIKCTNAGGSDTEYVNVDVADAPATVSAPLISLSPSGNTSIAYGGYVSFSWTVTPSSGTTCQAAGTGVNGATGSGAISTSGYWTSPALYTDTSYGIKCTNAGGIVTKQVNVDVADAPVAASVSAPTISLNHSNSTSAAYGGTVTFTWSVSPTSGTTCSAVGNGINGTGSGAISTSGSWTTPALYTDTTYGIQCSNAGGSSSKQVSVDVASAPAAVNTAPSLSYVSPGSATVGQSTTFSLSGSNFVNGATIKYTNITTGGSGTLTPSYGGASQLSVTVTPGAAGIITFAVVNPNGEQSNAGSVTVN